MTSDDVTQWCVGKARGLLSGLGISSLCGYGTRLGLCAPPQALKSSRVPREGASNFKHGAIREKIHLILLCRTCQSRYGEDGGSLDKEMVSFSAPVKQRYTCYFILKIWKQVLDNTIIHHHEAFFCLHRSWFVPPSGLRSWHWQTYLFKKGQSGKRN